MVVKQWDCYDANMYILVVVVVVVVVVVDDVSSGCQGS